MLRHVSADCAYIICEIIKPEEVANSCLLSYILQQNIMFYYIKVAFLICFLQCVTEFKVQ